MIGKLKCPYTEEELKEIRNYPAFKATITPELIANEIIYKIPAGHAVESIEPVPSTESRSGEACLRIKLKRIDDDSSEKANSQEHKEI